MRAYVCTQKVRQPKEGRRFRRGKTAIPPSRKKNQGPLCCHRASLHWKDLLPPPPLFPEKKNSRPCSIVNACSPLQCVQKKFGENCFFLKKRTKINPDRNKKICCFQDVSFLPPSFFSSFHSHVWHLSKITQIRSYNIYFCSLRGGGRHKLARKRKKKLPDFRRQY